MLLGNINLSEVGIGESINTSKESGFAKLNFMIANYKYRFLTNRNAKAATFAFHV